MREEPDVIFCRMASEVKVTAREIDVRAVPYSTPALVYDERENRVYTESMAPGAFTVDPPQRPNRVKVLRDHDATRLVGHCRAIRPNKPDGLHCTFQISRTPLGNESLELARDGSLHVSVGFAAHPSGDQWSEDRSSVVRTKCELWEVSLVPFPAYEGAEVLAVRRSPLVSELPELELALPVPTPNLDEIRAWRMQQEYDRYRPA